MTFEFIYEKYFDDIYRYCYYRNDGDQYSAEEATKRTFDVVWRDWETVKESTCKAEGKEERTCSLCNHKEEKTIEKLEHKFGDWEVVSGNVVIPPIVKEQECELCGYTETVKDFGYVWVTVLAVIAVIGLGVGVASYFKAFRRP